MNGDINIIPCDPEKHWIEIWTFMQPVFESGDSYPNAIDTTSDEARAYWFAEEKTTFVAADSSGEILGVYYIRPNQPTLGAHICNCGYVVAASARGRGVASLMCEHSQDFARDNGYRGMQYNLVVSSNEGAIRLWKKHGFDIIGTTPGAFAHKDLGYVDAHIMFKSLV